MTVWTLRATTPAGDAIGELTAATDRTVTFDLDAAATASFSIDGRHAEAELVDELVTDLVMARDREDLFRGRFGASGDEVDDAHKTTLAAVDYRGLLARRILYDPQTFAAQDQFDIAWALIDYTQSLAGGDAGITRGSATSGVVRDRAFEAGKSIGPLLDELGDVDDGFDWEIDAALVWRAWYPQRGAARDLVLSWPAGTIQSFRRQVDPSTYANAVRVSGDETTTPATLEAGDLVSRPEGRFDYQAGYPDVVEDATLTAKADGLLADRETIQPGYTLTLKPGLWTPSSLWLGDTVRIVIRSGRLDVDTFQRVRRVTVGIDESDNETVTIETGARQSTQVLRQLGIDLRLAALERR